MRFALANKLSTHGAQQAGCSSDISSFFVRPFRHPSTPLIPFLIHPSVLCTHTPVHVPSLSANRVTHTSKSKTRYADGTRTQVQRTGFSRQKSTDAALVEIDVGCFAKRGSASMIKEALPRLTSFKVRFLFYYYLNSEADISAVSMLLLASTLSERSLNSSGPQSTTSTANDTHHR